MIACKIIINYNQRLYNKNVKLLLEKEHTYLLEYDNLCKK